MKLNFFITILVLVVANLVTARYLMEASESEDDIDSIVINSKERDEHVSEQKTAESATLEVELSETSTFVNVEIEKVAELLSGDLEKLESDDNSAINETREEIREVVVKRHGKAEKDTKHISENAEEGNSSDDKQNIHTNVESDIQETLEEEYSKENQFNKDSVEVGVHLHGNVPSKEQDIDEVIFEIEPIGIKTSQKRDSGSVSDEDTSMVTNRNARHDILLERRLMLNHELMQKKLAAAQALDALAKMGSSRNYVGDLTSHTTKLYNHGPYYHHPLPYNPTSPHDSLPIFYHDNIQHVANPYERAGFTVDLESNSYPYTPSANAPERRVVNTIVHLPYQGYHNIDHTYSPVKNPIIVGGNGRLKRNVLNVDRPPARYSLPHGSTLF